MSARRRKEGEDVDGEGDAASVNSQASVASGGDDRRPAAPMAAPTAANVIDPDVYDRRAEGSGDGVDPDRLASSAPAEVMEKVVTRRGRGLKTEERSNDPTVVPRRGAFFMHDDRFDAKEERARVGHEDGDGQARRGGRNAPRGGRAHDSPTAAAEHTPSNTPSPRTPDVGRGAEGRAPRGGGAPRPRALWDDAADRQPDRWTHDRFTPADSTGAAAGGGGDKASPREHHTGGKRGGRGGGSSGAAPRGGHATYTSSTSVVGAPYVATSVPVAAAHVAPGTAAAAHTAPAIPTSSSSSARPTGSSKYAQSYSHTDTTAAPVSRSNERAPRAAAAGPGAPFKATPAPAPSSPAAHPPAPVVTAVAAQSSSSPAVHAPVDVPAVAPAPAPVHAVAAPVPFASPLTDVDFAAAAATLSANTAPPAAAAVPMYAPASMAVAPTVPMVVPPAVYPMAPSGVLSFPDALAAALAAGGGGDGSMPSAAGALSMASFLPQLQSYGFPGMMGGAMPEGAGMASMGQTQMASNGVTLYQSPTGEFIPAPAGMAHMGMPQMMPSYAVPGMDMRGGSAGGGMPPHMQMPLNATLLPGTHVPLQSRLPTGMMSAMPMPHHGMQAAAAPAGQNAAAKEFIPAAYRRT